MPFCMKPLAFQTRSMPCATPLVLVQRTLTVWVPAASAGRLPSKRRRKQAVGALVGTELRREPRRPAVAENSTAFTPQSPPKRDAADGHRRSGRHLGAVGQVVTNERGTIC